MLLAGGYVRNQRGPLDRIAFHNYRELETTVLSDQA